MTLLKFGSLLILVVQNASLVLIMRYARTRSGDMFLSTTAVLAAEIIKLVFCLMVILFKHNGNVPAFLHYLIDVSSSVKYVYHFFHQGK